MKEEDYIKKWLEGTLSEEERRGFEESEQFKSINRLSNAVLAFKAPDYDVEAGLSRLDKEKASKSGGGKSIAIKWVKPLLRVAAIFVLLSVGYVYFTRESLTSIQTLAAEKTQVVLPDSSHVTLNAYSSLAYPQKNWNNKRMVTLEGEGFFKVAKGSKFDVETPLGVVSVLGTEFNVKNRENYFEVICYEGLVQVQSTDQVVKLEPNHMFRIINGEVSTKEVALKVSPSWLEGESSFTSVPLQYVIKEFERQYDVSVSIENVDVTQRFTGAFVHNDMTLALNSITLPVNITYQLEENKRVTLSGN